MGSAPEGHRRRVVITGLGIVSSIGLTVKAFWDALTSGSSGVRAITRFDSTAFPVHLAGELSAFDPLDHLARRDVVRTDPFIHYALVAAQAAVTDAEVAERCDPEKLGVSVGTGIGGISWMTSNFAALEKGGAEAVSAYSMPGYLPNMAAGWLSMRLGARGPIMCPTTACAAGTQAIGEAFRAIQTGLADVMVAGGADAGINPLIIASFCALRALSTNPDPHTACRPFDRDRDGFVLAEGAALLVLEERERAIARGARIYAEIAGYGLTADAHHPTAASESGAERAMRLALADARLPPESIDYINAHGTSTPLNDRVETAAIRKLFGDHAGRICVSSTKSMTGHAIAASGGMEAAATALTISHRVIPPTIHLHNPDPDCDLDYVPNTARHGVTVDAAVSNSFAFGGVNAILVLTRHE